MSVRRPESRAETGQICSLFAQRQVCPYVGRYTHGVTGRRSEFERFIGRVHRRYLALRILECAGLGVLGGCAAAALLLTIALWRGYPAFNLAVSAVAAGAAAGLLWGLTTRPTPLAAAMEADRQLGWADLLSSALTTRQTNDDPWIAAVAAAADTRCRGAAPSSVILNRLGARAWGGVGLAAALVIVLGLLPTYAAPTRAGEQSSSLNPFAVPQPPETQRIARATPTARRTPPQQEPTDGSASRMGTDPSDPQSQDRNNQPPGNSTAARQGTSSDPNGQGTGAAHSDVRSPSPPALHPDATHARAIGDGSKATSGVGESNSHPRGGQDAAAGSAAAVSPEEYKPPWSSSQRPQRVRQARALLERGQVPDAYRDVVREYFDRRQ